MNRIGQILSTVILVALPVLGPMTRAMATDELACGNSVAKDTIEICSRVLSIGNLSRNRQFMALYNRAWAYRRAGRNDQALEDLRAASRLRNDFAKLFLTKSLVERDLGNVSDALNDASRYVEREPGDWVGYQNRALLLRELGRNGGAYDDIEAAIRLNPSSKELRVMRVLIQADIGLLVQARAEAGRLSSRGAQWGISQFARAYVLVREGRKRESERELDNILIAMPQFSAAYALRGQLRQARGDVDGAKQDFLKALHRSDPAIDSRSALKSARAGLAQIQTSFQDATRPEPNGDGRYTTTALESGKSCRLFLPLSGVTVPVECSR